MGDAFREAFSGYSILGLLIAGIVLGLLGKLFAPGAQKIPFWLTIVAGIVGALLGNIVAALFGVRDTSGIDWIRHILQVAGAVVAVIAAASLYKGKTRA